MSAAPGGDDPYKQFSDMLNHSTSASSSASDPQPDPTPTLQAPNNASQAPKSPPTDEDQRRDKYAEFSALLGVENVDSVSDTPPERRDTIEKATIKPIEIDPADYNIFNNLLKKSGGTGRKPVKGSKRWTRSPSEPDIIPSEDTTIAPKPVSDNIAPSYDEKLSRPPSRPREAMSAEEAADGYSMMMEKFGSGMHDVIDSSTEVGKKIAPVAKDLPALASPPKRPLDLSTSQTQPTKSDGFFDENVEVPLAELPVETVEPPPLVPKPSRPGEKTTEAGSDAMIESKETFQPEHNADSEDSAVIQPVVSPTLQDKPKRAQPKKLSWDELAVAKEMLSGAESDASQGMGASEENERLGVDDFDEFVTSVMELDPTEAARMAAVPPVPSLNDKPDLPARMVSKPPFSRARGARRKESGEVRMLKDPKVIAPIE